MTLASWLVGHWQQHCDQLDDPDHRLPDPDDLLAVAEHVSTHPYPKPRDGANANCLPHCA